MKVLATWLCLIGSPFTVEIASPAVVTLYGEGLDFGQRGQKTMFMIDTAKQTDICDINVIVSRESSATCFHYLENMACIS